MDEKRFDSPQQGETPSTWKYIWISYQFPESNILITGIRAVCSTTSKYVQIISTLASIRGWATLFQKYERQIDKKQLKQCFEMLQGLPMARHDYMNSHSTTFSRDIKGRFRLSIKQDHQII